MRGMFLTVSLLMLLPAPFNARAESGRTLDPDAEATLRMKVHVCVRSSFMYAKAGYLRDSLLKSGTPRGSEKKIQEYNRVLRSADVQIQNFGKISAMCDEEDWAFGIELFSYTFPAIGDNSK